MAITPKSVHQYAPVHLPKYFWKNSTADSPGVLKMLAPVGCHFHSHVFSVILYNPQRRYILLPVNTVKQSSLHRCPTCPPPVLSEVHPSQTARVPLSHKHESKHYVLPQDFLSFNKGNERNKKQCRVADITTSPTILNMMDSALRSPGKEVKIKL